MDLSGPTGVVPGDEDERLDETLVGEPEGAERSEALFEPGAQIGRYVVLAEVGSGGMGVVYAAFDPQLNRKIALKIMRPRGSGANADARAKDRLMREAQAIARVSHPNVVSVFDVGTVGDAVFVAMEFVEGVTLTRWLESMSRPVPQTVGAFVQAGRGLAAAHRAGLVHRDFKPDNVLVGEDGVVRVSDFGLARADPSVVDDGSFESADVDDPSPLPVSDSDVLSSPLTQIGSVVGTPRYMAPEQHVGEVTDPRSDQFSFCVALYQALYGQDPFVARTMERLALAKREGRVAPPPSGARVQHYLEDIVMRGLSPRPVSRFDSMDQLVAALERDPAAARRQRLLIAGTVLCVGGGAAAFGYYQAQGDETCRHASKLVEGVWDAHRKADVENALISTDVPYAGRTWTEVDRRLTQYTEDWVRVRTEACEATHVHHEQSGTLLDLRIMCLDRNFDAMKALVDVLARADEDVVRRAAAAAAGLPRLELCSDTEFLFSQVEPASDAEVAEDVELARTLTAQAQAESSAGKYRESLESARRAKAAADQVDYPPVLAEALLQLGGAHENLGEYDDAEAALTESVWVATRSKHDAVAAAAATRLVGVVGDRLARHKEGLRWAAHARSILDRVGTEGTARATLDLITGNVLYRMGDLEEAREHYTRAIVTRESVLGDVDPGLAGWLVNLGNVQYAQQRYDDAIITFERALSLAENSLGREHPFRSTAQASLGIVYLDLDRLDEAESYMIPALANFRESMGARHPFVAALLSNLGLVDYERERYTAAQRRLDEALGIYAETVGTRHPDYARALHNLGRIALASNNPDEARRRFERAFEIRTDVFGDSHLDVAESTHWIAAVDLVDGRVDEAILGFERALHGYDANEGDIRERARCRFGLARALQSRGDHERSRATAEVALDQLRSIGDRGRNDLAEVEAFLRPE